jgi:O-antigen biosynthesis protein
LGNGRPVADLYGSAGILGTGANMAFRRSLFHKVGYFDPALDVGTPTMGGGDLEMFFRVLKERGALLYEPAAIVRHRHRQTLSALRIQIAGWGTGFGSYLIRSALAYPDERTPLFKRGLWWLWNLNVKRTFLTRVDPFRLPWDLILAEAFGSWISPFCYLAARSIANKFTAGSAPPSPLAIPQSLSASGKGARENPKPAGEFTVDLHQPFSCLTDAADYEKTRINALWKGRNLGSLFIPNCYQPIGKTRLREALVEALGLRLTDPEGEKSLDQLKAETDAALSRIYWSS